eukprot:6032638-Amphidinium_carterae.2
MSAIEHSMADTAQRITEKAEGMRLQVSSVLGLLTPMAGSWGNTNSIRLQGILRGRMLGLNQIPPETTSNLPSVMRDMQVTPVPCCAEAAYSCCYQTQGLKLSCSPLTARHGPR